GAQIQGVGGDRTNATLHATRSRRSLILIAQLEKVLWAGKVLAGVVLVGVLAAVLSAAFASPTRGSVLLGQRRACLLRFHFVRSRAAKRKDARHKNGQPLLNSLVGPVHRAAYRTLFGSPCRLHTRGGSGGVESRGP